MIEATPYESLPASWGSFNLKSFSRQKQFWDYQQQAVASAIAGLWRYNEDLADYQRGESLNVNLERKQRFFEWYQEDGLPEGMSLQLARLGRRLRQLLDEYQEQQTWSASHRCPE